MQAEEYSKNSLNLAVLKTKLSKTGKKNAFLVCTDSFHSAVFAFLFNTPFITFNRNNTKINMNSRMDTFLSDFGLKDRKYDVGRNLDEYLESDYSSGYKILEQKREEAKKFFARAFS